MKEFIKKFWQDDAGDGYISPLLQIIFVMTASAVVFTATFIGFKNLAIKNAQQMQSINP
jgi:hypothetical protein